jgi:glycine cleavage system transcriptional repressor
MRLLLKSTTKTNATKNTIPYSVEVSALDNPGIVRNIASFFSNRNINIVNAQTERYAAPHTGSPMFVLHMTVGIPAEVNIAQLREAFMDTCDELNLDAELISI